MRSIWGRPTPCPPFQPCKAADVAGVTRRIMTVVVPAAAVLILSAACAAQPQAGPARVDDALVEQAPKTGPAGLGGFAALPGEAVKSTDVIVDKCKPKPGPPYQIGAVGSFGGGSVTIIDGVKVSGISGHFCAVATVVAAPKDTHPNATVCANLVAPPEGLQFDDVETELNLIPGVTSIIGKVSITPEALSAYICDDGTPGELKLNTVIQAAAVPELFGTECHVGPLQAEVTATFTGPLSSVKATLSSKPFKVTAVQASAKCPEGLARNTNEILGLPLEQSVEGLSIGTAAALYLPQQPTP